MRETWNVERGTGVRSEPHARAKLKISKIVVVYTRAGGILHFCGYPRSTFHVSTFGAFGGAS